MRRLLMLVFLSACRVPSDGALEEPPPVVEAPPAPTGVEAAPAAPPTAPEEEQLEGEDEGPEEIELEWPEGAFEVDLDGDGKAEKVSWTCEGKTRVQAGEASFEEKHGYSDLMGCTTTTVDLDPSRPGRELLFIGDEHEEVGPDRHVILAYAEGKLSLVWADDASISFFPDGSWVSEVYDCDDVDLVFTTTTDTHRWRDGKVETQTEIGTEKIEAGDCAEP